MKPYTYIALAIYASLASAQDGILTPTTICRGVRCTTYTEAPVESTAAADEGNAPTVVETTTMTETHTETEVQVETTSITLIEEVTVTVTSTTERILERTYTTTDLRTITATITAVQTTTAACSAAASCPTLTMTGTACQTCLVPGCTSTVQATRPCGCSGDLPTATVNFACNDPGVCNRIGCKTVYDIVTEGGC